jgi:NADH dehydrogenase FAD-containing subunit
MRILTAFHEKLPANADKLRPETICIVGAGFSGSCTLRHLAEASQVLGGFNITLVDEMDCFEYTPGITRLAAPAAARARVLEQIHVQYHEYVKECTVVHGKVHQCVPERNGPTEEAKFTVHFEDGSQIGPFDYLVVATGSSYPLPISPALSTSQPAPMRRSSESSVAKRSNHSLPVPITIVQRGRPLSLAIHRALDDLRNSRDTHETSKQIVIIGGGATGVELAAEFASNFASLLLAQKLRVTLYHSGSGLLPRLKSSWASEYAAKFLQKRGVQVIIGCKVALEENNAESPVAALYRLNPQPASPSLNGSSDAWAVQPIEATWAFYCASPVPNTHVLSATCSTTSNGIPVHHTFQYMDPRFPDQVPYSGLFVCGDAASLYSKKDPTIRELKLAQCADQHGYVVGKNILALMQHHESLQRKNQSANTSGKPKLLEYHVPSTRPMVISLGEYDGLFVFGDLVIAGVFAAMSKMVVEAKTMLKFNKPPAWRKDDSRTASEADKHSAVTHHV